MPSSDGRRLLEATGLRRAYGRRQVLRDIDLTVAAGVNQAAINYHFDQECEC